MKETPRALRLDEIRRALVDAGLDGWLFYDFRGLDPIARKVLGLDPTKAGSRRWFYLIRARGEPAKLVHAIETGMLDALPGGKATYLSWQSLEEGLRAMLGGARRVAMQHSPRNEVPTISRVDGGTLELVRSLGTEVVTSADLVQLFDATLSVEQLESHRRAAVILRSLVEEVFERAASEVGAGRPLNEGSLLAFLENRLRMSGLVRDHPPIVAVNAHAADPHFEVPETGSAPIRRGDLLLVDLWAKESKPGAVYADITWTAFLGERVPEDILEVFTVVRDARNAAVARARQAFRSGSVIRGFEVDRAAREVIEKAGYGRQFIHRTGHSIHEECHGNGANMDDLETHDTRVILPRALFSVEPGIYLPGRFGIRSEVDVFHTGSDAEVTGPPHQEEIRALLRR
jgi:Xaa-Pro aminopeptidase